VTAYDLAQQHCNIRPAGSPLRVILQGKRQAPNRPRARQFQAGERLLEIK
jgi:hypothetical protein